MFRYPSLSVDSVGYLFSSDTEGKGVERMDIFCLVFLLVFGIGMTAWGVGLLFKPPQPLIDNRPLKIGVADEISKLVDLKERGMITDEEYHAMKTELISSTPRQIPKPNAISPIILAIIFTLLALLFWWLAFS